MASFEFDDPGSYDPEVDSHPAKRSRTEAPSQDESTTMTNGEPVEDGQEGDQTSSELQLELNRVTALATLPQHDTHQLNDYPDQQQSQPTSNGTHLVQADGSEEPLNAVAGPSKLSPSASAGPDGPFDQLDEHETTSPSSKGKGKSGRNMATADPIAAQERLDKIRSQGRERQRRKRERDRAKRDSGGTTTGPFPLSPSTSTISTSSIRKRQLSPSGTSSTRSHSQPHGSLQAYPDLNGTSPSPDDGPTQPQDPYPSGSNHNHNQLESTSAAHQILSLSAAISSQNTEQQGSTFPPPPPLSRTTATAPSANSQLFASTILRALEANEGVMSQLRENFGLSELDLGKMFGGFGEVYDTFVAASQKANGAGGQEE